MRTHATSCIRETGLKIFNGFPIFLNGFPIFLNGFPLSEKSKKIYSRRQVYKRSPFELRISRHLLPELTKYSYSECFMNNACISPNTWHPFAHTWWQAWAMVSKSDSFFWQCMQCSLGSSLSPYYVSSFPHDKGYDLMLNTLKPSLRAYGKHGINEAVMYNMHSFNPHTKFKISIKKVGGNLTLPLPYIQYRKLSCRWEYKTWVFGKQHPFGGIRVQSSTFRYGSAAKGKPVLLNQAKWIPSKDGGGLRRDTWTLCSKYESKKTATTIHWEGNAWLFHSPNNNLWRHSLLWDWNHEPF